MGREKIKRETKREKKNFRRNERVRYCCLQEDSKRGESKALPHLKEIISVYMRVKKNKKNKRDFSLTVRHTQELL